MDLPPLVEESLDPLLSRVQGKTPNETIFGAIAVGKELGRKIVQGIHEGTVLEGTPKSCSSFSGCLGIATESAQNDGHLRGQEEVDNGGSCMASQLPKTDAAVGKPSCQKAVSFFKSRCELGTPLSGRSADKALQEDFNPITDRTLKTSILRQTMLSALSAILTLTFSMVVVIIPSVRISGTSEEAMGKTQHTHSGKCLGILPYGFLVSCLCILGLASLGECNRFRDVDYRHNTARKAAGKVHKAEQRAIRTGGDKQQFMTYVFHNIRVPFNAIVLGLGHLRSMADKNFSGMQITENRDLIQMMLDCAESMTSVLDDVSEMGQWEDGAKELNVEEFDLFGLVKFLLWGLKDLLYQKQIRFSMIVDPVAKTVLSSNHVLGDKHRILQTLGNFLSNAVKFSPSGGKLELSIKCEEIIKNNGSKPCHDEINRDGSEQAQDTTLCPCLRVEGLRNHSKDPSKLTTCSQRSLAKVLITVKDTGNGISPQDQKKLFEPYSFVSSGWVQVAGVSGLGLSVAKQFVEQAGGYIGVKSKDGEGSMFYFCLPYPLIPIMHNPEVKDTWLGDFMSEEKQQCQIPPTAKKQDDIGQGANVAANSPAIDKGSKKVLLVEDTEINRIILRKVLQTLELSCEEAENGQVAVDLLKQGRAYDLILMDKEMPVMDGHEATRQIRLLGVKTPIVALTGNALHSDRKLFLEAGVDDFQTKPLSRDKLVQVLIRFGVEIPCA